MIYEYALDPKVLLLWASSDRDHAEFYREYGIGTPRIFSSFPKKKASKLRSYLLRFSPPDSQSLASRRYTEMVVKLTESIVNRNVKDCQENDWAGMVVVENQERPFDIILSSEAIELNNNITSRSMYLPDSIWNHPREYSIHRTNSDFLLKISNFLRLCNSRVIIIDPYGWRMNSIKFIRFMLKNIMTDRVNPNSPEITIFYKEKVGESARASYVKNSILEDLPENSVSLQIKVFELKETSESDVFHNRCILTEHGGISTGHGINLPDEKSHTDDMFLLGPELYQKKWQQFSDEICFKVVSES